jgi:hypothetical protein
MTKQTNTRYHIRNWEEYNRALVNRGSLTIWFSKESLEKWNAEPSRKRGRPRVYSDEAILCALMVKAVYRPMAMGPMIQNLYVLIFMRTGLIP